MKRLPTAAILGVAVVGACNRNHETPKQPTTEVHAQAFRPPSRLYTEEEKARMYRHPYRFTTDWFTLNVPRWRLVFEPYRDKPGVRYLEVGVYEGRSALWMLDNVLTHPTSRMTVVDIFLPGIEERWLANVSLSGARRRVTTIRGRSAIELRRLPLDFFDIIYIDGSHAADDVMIDAVLSWGLLKPGGLLLFDDYPFAAERTPELQPRTAIDSFITLFRSSLQVLHRSNQLLVRKTANPCDPTESRSPLGRFCYDWYDLRLHPQGGGDPLPLTPREADLVRTLLQSRPFGRTEYQLDAATLSAPELRPLAERLGLNLGAEPSIEPALPGPLGK